MEVKKLLLPVDGSESSDKAAQYCAELALTLGASVVLLNSHKAVPATLGSPNREEYRDKLVAEAKAILEPYEKLLADAQVPFESKMIGGPAAEVIFDSATSESVDMIVMGSRGKSDLEGLIVGSVTHRLLHIAPCPVLVIR